MSRGRRASLRRILTSLLSLAVALSVVAAVPAFAVSQGIYEHGWPTELAISGDFGGRLVKIVDENTVELTRSGTTWSGTIRYVDRLGILEPTGDVSARRAVIELELTGSDSGDGKGAGGTFTGTATLATAPIAKPDDVDATGPGDYSVLQTYEVSGDWGGVLSGGQLRGEVLYESAFGYSAGGRAPNDASFFNRLSTEREDALGDAQTFLVELTQEDAPSGGGADDPEPDDPSALERVLRGISGPAGLPMTVHASQRSAAQRLADARPKGATPLPETAMTIDVDVSGAYLDAKNRAAGLLDDDGPTEAMASLGPAWDEVRQATARPVAPGNVSRVAFYSERVSEGLDARPDVEGAGALATDLRLLAGARETAVDPAPLLKVWSEVVASVANGTPGSVLAQTAAAARLVLDTPVPKSGALADAVLVAAAADDAPADARVVDRFERIVSFDTSGSAEGILLPDLVLRRHGVDTETGRGLPWATAAGGEVLAPETWAAYESPDGRLFWRSGDAGEVALADGSIRGWAHTATLGVLVEALHVGRVLAVFPLG